MGFIWTVAKRHFLPLIGAVIMLLFPMYASVRAIESPSSPQEDQHHWLTYWIIYSLLTLFEFSCMQLLQWIVLWPYVKLVLCMWLALPGFNGAAYIYEEWIRRYMIKLGSAVGSAYLEPQRRQVLSMISCL